MSQKEHLTIRWAFGTGQNAEIDFTRDELLKICDQSIPRWIRPIWKKRISTLLLWQVDRLNFPVCRKNYFKNWERDLKSFPGI